MCGFNEDLWAIKREVSGIVNIPGQVAMIMSVLRQMGEQTH